MIFHENRQQTILMKYHALFVIFEKAAQFEIVFCYILKVMLYELTLISFWKMVNRYSTCSCKLTNCEGLDEICSITMAFQHQGLYFLLRLVKPTARTELSYRLLLYIN